MKLFIATPISSFKIKEEYIAYRKKVVQLISELRKDHSVICELDEINSKEEYDSSVESLKKDYTAISNCDAFILHYPTPTPTSALIELGFAIALNKRIIIVTPNKTQLPYLVQELDFFGKNYFIIESNHLENVTTRRIVEILSK